MNDQFWGWLNRYRSVDSLKRLKALQAKYLNNDSRINYIHVTGTNGKGSVSRYLHQLLSQGLNLKVGLFTSPHITIINERIVINGEMISDQDLLRIKEIIAQDVDTYQLGFFAILTLIALIYFQEQKVDWAIIEVGIGGLFDATNIIKSDYCVITSIAQDHTEILGNNLTKILDQKLGIVKSSTKRLFVSGNINNKLKLQIEKNINNSKIIFSEKLNNSSYYQQNQELVKTIIGHIFPDFNKELVNKIIETTNINLRFEKFSFKNKTIYFDVAHNLAGIKALIKVLHLRKITIDKIIFSALVTKNPEILIKELKKITENIVICNNPHPQTIPGENFNLITMIENDANKNILVTGSCYFAADVYNQLRNKQK